MWRSFFFALLLVTCRRWLLFSGAAVAISVGSAEYPAILENVRRGGGGVQSIAI